MLKYITLFDTGIATDNLGDDIIMQSVAREAQELFPKGFFVRVGTHDRIGPVSRKFARESYVSFVGGTNLLCSNWFYKSQWKVGLRDFWRIGNPVLMGVGWRFYQRRTDWPTAWMLRFMLSRKYIHSVRDSYTENRLREAGIDNVINTGCPTMWKLTEEHCTSIPATRGENALVTVTAYRHNPELDRKWIELVLAKYKTVYFWPQMHDDLKYMEDIAGDRVVVLDSNLDAFDRALDYPSIDYIGTRLHGGVRALQHKCRSLIIEVDNRATEIARDTGLPTMRRDDVDFLSSWIDEPAPTVIKMPWQKIEQWKAQFREQPTAQASAHKA